MTMKEGPMAEDDVISRYTNEQAIADGIKAALPFTHVFITTNLLRQVMMPLLDVYNERADKDDLMVTTKLDMALGGGPLLPSIEVWLIEDGDGLTLLAPEDY